MIKAAAGAKANHQQSRPTFSCPSTRRLFSEGVPNKAAAVAALKTIRMGMIRTRLSMIFRRKGLLFSPGKMPKEIQTNKL
jgi:hypothetical protein